MARIKYEQAEKNAVEMAAALMAASARTAPKARGIDDIESLILDGNDLEELAAAMEHKTEEKPSHLSVILSYLYAPFRVPIHKYLSSTANALTFSSFPQGRCNCRHLPYILSY